MNSLSFRIAAMFATLVIAFSVLLLRYKCDFDQFNEKAAC